MADEMLQKLKMERRVIVGDRQDIKEAFRNSERGVMDQLDVLNRRIDDILDDESKLKELEDLTRDVECVLDDFVQIDESKIKELKKKHDEIKEKVKRLKGGVISSLEKLQSSETTGEKASHGQAGTTDQPSLSPELQDRWSKKDPELETILEDAAKQFYLSEYNKLDPQLKICLLCFSIFPQGSFIKKRTLIYWWIGEGFVTPTAEKTAEEMGEKCFYELIKCTWIDPVNNKSNETVHECTMGPLVRWMVIYIARKESFFDLDDTGKPSSPPVKSRRDCLMPITTPTPTPPTRLESDSSSNGKKKNTPKNQEGGLKRSFSQEYQGASLWSVFNVNEKRLSTKELSSKLKMMKSLVVLHLGMWQNSAEHHIELDTDPQSFGSLLSLFVHLRYLGLAGISRLRELPTSIKKLRNLKILDLRGCQNLEILGREITFLKRLTHLDVSECYMLDQMPKGLSSLSELQVLKGFVFGSVRSHDPCRLAELTKLQKLKKLSISIGGEAHILKKEMIELKEIKGLRSLAITWGKLSVTLSDEDREKLEEEWMNLDLPADLEKLDLRCFPKEETLTWLEPNRLEKLTKLYIRGGKLTTLSFQNRDETSQQNSKVQVLRLKFLHQLKMTWPEVEKFFPSLTYVEIHDCPLLDKLLPLDSDGVWIGEEKTDPAVNTTALAPTTAPLNPTQVVAPPITSDVGSAPTDASAHDHKHASPPTTTSSLTSAPPTTSPLVAPPVTPDLASPPTDDSSFVHDHEHPPAPNAPTNTPTSAPPTTSTLVAPPVTPDLASAPTDDSSLVHDHEHPPAPNAPTNTPTSAPPTTTPVVAPLVTHPDLASAPTDASSSTQNHRDAPDPTAPIYTLASAPPTTKRVVAPPVPHDLASAPIDASALPSSIHDQGHAPAPATLIDTLASAPPPPPTTTTIVAPSNTPVLAATPTNTVSLASSSTSDHEPSPAPITPTASLASAPVVAPDSTLDSSPPNSYSISSTPPVELVQASIVATSAVPSPGSNPQPTIIPPTSVPTSIVTSGSASLPNAATTVAPSQAGALIVDPPVTTTTASGS